MDTRKRTAIGVGAVAVAMLAIAIGAFAAFTDTEAGPSGTATAGTLDLEVGGSGQAVLFTRTDVKPGDTFDATLTVNNVGSVNGTLKGTITVTGADNTCVEPEQEASGCGRTSGDLPDQMLGQIVSGPGISTPLAAVPLSTFATQGIPAGNLDGRSGPQTYTFRFTLPSTADNKVQSDSVTVATNFVLDQR